jgi:hypothetical protein
MAYTPIRRRNCRRSSAYRVFFTASLAVVVSACSQAKPIGLAIEGYNYTNRFIDSFTVTDEDGNGAWGGNVYLSTPTSGGGGGTCCVMLNPHTTRPVRLRINWTIGRIDDESGRTIAPALRKEAWVAVAPPFPDDPKTFEVHFYPNGHVEAAITHWPSSPRIKLPEGRGEKP